ncbi:CTP synthase [Candidatus Dependentiae bacterium]|nr:CTP synthase [Candidatus Dependentiae bacterium]
MQKDELLRKVIKKKTRFVVITGGVCSSLGKGVLVSSIGVLLKNSGYSVSVVKWDPYLNVDPGTMSPLVHGEVFVTDDGAETDLDLGHYERFLNIHLDKTSSVSSGQIFKEILDGEREGKYLGKDIQFVPHVVDAIKNRLLNFAIDKNVDFVLVEIGGTVGDMEGIAFLEAVRQLKMDLADRQLMLCHLSLVPFLSWANELKTKPTQHSVILLKKAGLMPDSLFLRSDRKVGEKSKEKLSIMCGVHKDLIFESLTWEPVYKLFLDLQQQDVNKRIQNWFSIKKSKKADLSKWKKLIKKIEKEKEKITIGLIAKYVGSNDPYLSVIKALESACYANGYDVDIQVIDAQKIEKENLKKGTDIYEQVKKLQGLIIPGGFDKRGIVGKILAAKYARENKIPYLGLCLGMQVMLIEYAQSVLKITDASSTEFNKSTKNPIISLLEEQAEIVKKGGTMRLGKFPCTIIPETLAYKAYKKKEVWERHRHRYEFNNAYKKTFEKSGVVFSGIYKKKDLVEISELKNHPFMLGCQFHPEFLSTPLKPHPLFNEFIRAILAKKS